MTASRFSFSGWHVLISMLVIVIGEGGCWLHAQPAVTAALRELHFKQIEQTQLTQHRPRLTEENTSNLFSQQQSLEPVLAAARLALVGHAAGRLSRQPPVEAIGLFFDLADFIKQSRELAAQAQVVTRPMESFGFADYAHVSPALDVAPIVFRQRLIAEQVLKLLFAARPVALLALKRERPLLVTPQKLGQQLSPISAHTESLTSSSGSEGSDFFIMPSAWTLRVPAQIECTALRVEFTGQTRSLRVFLQSLADFDLPLIVRCVAVEAWSTPNPPQKPVGSVAGANPVPLVSPICSKFSVIIEAIEVLPSFTP